MIIFLTIPQRYVIAPEILHTGAIRAESTRMSGALHNAPPRETQQQRRHQLVHRNAANVATENMTYDAHVKIVHKTGSCKNQKQHAIGCESIHNAAHDSQLTVQRTAGVRRELRDQFIAARNRRPPWSTKASFRTARGIEHQDVVSSGIPADEFGDKHPREWTKQSSKTLEEATEAYLVKVTAKSHSRSSY